MPRPRPNLQPLNIPENDRVEQWLDHFDEPDSIDESAEYSLNLGAESPASSLSFEERIPTPPPRPSSRRRSLQKPSRKRDVDRDCGICFEYAVQPCRTLCCGKIFCHEHITDWLNGPSSDGCCPSCSAPCSSDTNILSLASPTLLTNPPSRVKHPLSDENTSDHSTRHRSQSSSSTSNSKQSRTSDSSQTSSSEGTVESSILGLTSTPEESEEEDVGGHWLAYALGFAHTRQSQGTSPSPYPFIHPGSSTLEVLGRLTSVMGLTLLFYVLLAS